MVAPLVEALVLRAVRRREREQGAAPHPHPRSAAVRLVGPRRCVDTLGYVAEATSVLLGRAGAEVEVLGVGRLVVPGLLSRTRRTYVVVSHLPSDVALTLGPFDTADGRTVQQLVVQLRVRVSDSPATLADLAPLLTEGEPEEALLGRLVREVSSKAAEAIARRTLADLTQLSLGVLLDGTLPQSFVSGSVVRETLEVVDVDWPTEGRGWPVPAGALRS